MCGHFLLLRLRSGFHASTAECQMRGNSLFKIAQTRIAGLSQLIERCIFSLNSFLHLLFQRLFICCHRDHFQSTLFPCTGSILGDHRSSFPGRSGCASCAGAAKGQKQSWTPATAQCTTAGTRSAFFFFFFNPRNWYIMRRISCSYAVHENVGVHHDCQIC